MSPKTNDQFRNRALTAIGVIAALMLTAMAFAGEDPNQPLAAEVPAEAVVAVEPIAATAGSLQTIAFKKDMPITDALKMLAQMYQKNIIPSAKVSGNVTVGTLYDVTFDEALQAILGTHKYDMNGNFIRVYTVEEYKADKTRLGRDTITLYYINAEEAGKLAKPLLSEMGQIGVTTAAAKDMEVGKGGDTLSNRDMIVVSDYPENIKAIKEMIAMVDVTPPQVLIDVTVMEASLDETTQFGIDFDSFNGLVSTSSSDLFAAGQEGLNQGGFTNDIAGGMSVGILTDNVKVFIKALDSITDTTLLANPKILALNKQAGMVMIGDRVGYITTSNIGAEGATQQVEFLEGGTRLAFRPYVCDNGLIRMEINPKQSTPSVKVDGGFVLPNEKTTEVTTNVMVRDGKTIVLGGLFKEKTTLGRSQTPVLGDLPIIGFLFKGVNDKSERVELIVLVTPHIIGEPEQADGATRMQDVERLAARARQNLTWLSRAKIDEARYARAVKLYSEGNADAALAELEKQKQYGIDRTYLDPIRLEEKIVKEKQPDKVNQIERIMLGNLEKEESGKWNRR
jgi:type IV pilus assembly protein PilQ